MVKLAANLLGKVLCTDLQDGFSSGIICETEAYSGVTDKASHAFGGRRTPRTETMYLAGGHAYVYLCYGIHELFNVVTGEKDVPHAILIRGIFPLDGMELQAARRGNRWNLKTGIGPGNVSKCLGINRQLNGIDLNHSTHIWIEDRGIVVPSDEVKITARIGVDYAGEDASLPYRFVWDTNQFENLFQK